MSALPGIATAVLGVVPNYATGGPSWTIYRESGAGIASAPSVASAGTATLYVLQGKGRIGATQPNTVVSDTDWFVYGASSVTVQAGDVLYDGTYSFRIVGAPDTSQGYFVAAAEAAPSPV